jgi:putative hydrolase
MKELPMVNSPDDDEGDEVPEGPFGGENLPFEQIFASLGIPMPREGEPLDVSALLASLQNVMARSGQPMTTDGGGVNWVFAKDMARKVVAALGPDPTPTSRQRHDIADSVHLAELWLNDATVFPAVSAPPAAWSRAEWVENTMATWQTMVEPIVTTIASSLGEVMTKRLSDEPEMAGMQQMFQPMLQQSASSMFGVQFGQALGKLGTEVVSATEVSMPLLTRPQVALLPTNLAAFGEGLDLPERDVMLYLSLREAARQRLFADVGWRGPQLVAFVQHYAREITVDLSALEESFDGMGGEPVSMDDLAQLGSEMSKSLFSPQRTPEQAEVLGRLETLLALVEGWVDDVVAQATIRFMPTAGPLAETVRRRRATGGPAEQVFASLVGLELRPRRTRDAANLWAALRSARGVDGRDAVWHHPDTMPSTHDLDDPLGFVSGDSHHGNDDLDAELAKLLDEESGN